MDTTAYGGRIRGRGHVDYGFGQTVAVRSASVKIEVFKKCRQVADQWLAL